MYKVMSAAERRKLMESMIAEVQVYEEQRPTSQWLKSIRFKLPIIEEDLEISLDKDTQSDASPAENDCILLRKII